MARMKKRVRRSWKTPQVLALFERIRAMGADTKAFAHGAQSLKVGRNIVRYHYGLWLRSRKVASNGQSASKRGRRKAAAPAAIPSLPRVPTLTELAENATGLLGAVLERQHIGEQIEQERVRLAALEERDRAIQKRMSEIASRVTV